MKYCTGILAVLSLLLIMMACAPKQPPKPDPLTEEVAILQKQLLELQSLQNETRSRLDASNAAVSSLSARLQAMEERQTAKNALQPAVDSKPTTTSPGKKTSAAKKKPSKKTKQKPRRQE